MIFLQNYIKIFFKKIFDAEIYYFIDFIVFIACKSGVLLRIYIANRE